MVIFISLSFFFAFMYSIAMLLGRGGNATIYEQAAVPHARFGLRRRREHFRCSGSGELPAAGLVLLVTIRFSHKPH
uniref:Uncharacterized protein n=1 Tax=Rhipicephalus microplus TaxID=6941 RepID=A0A6M2DE30_RHIMP